ncbi:hypothetical protein CFOL_v3_05103, partial [Cephalotus follicularis]
CSFHMTPNRDLFTINDVKEGKVLLGDNNALKIVGCGKVQIKMFDGVIKTLEAWHVPGLKKNLISLGVLDSHGCKFTGENGIIKVLRGASVIMKGKKIDGLYQLQGNTV